MIGYIVESLLNWIVIGLVFAAGIGIVGGLYLLIRVMI
jgi:hypothetical protein